LDESRRFIKESLSSDLNSPRAITALDKLKDEIEVVSRSGKDDFIDFLKFIDRIFGLRLLASADITSDQKALIASRKEARRNNNFTEADKIRKKLEKENIALRDTSYGTFWERT
jgi:cysteinyl-tRNA synthetase